MTRPPNILLITTDEQRYDHLGLRGLTGIDTPNLDRLGREGIHFDRGYTSCPVCTPARVTLLTGQWPSQHGAYSIGVSVDPFPTPTVPQLLGEAGYATALFGKSHFVRRADEPSHVSGVADPSPDFWHHFDSPYLGFQFVRTNRGHTFSGIPDMHYRVWLEDQGVDYSQWFPDMTGQHDHDQCGTWNIPPEYHNSAWVSGNTIDYIHKQADQAPDQPWFIWTSFEDPHEPFVCPEPWYSSVRRDEMPDYEGYREGEYANKPAYYQQAYDAGYAYRTPDEIRDVDNEANQWLGFDDGKGIPSVFYRDALDARAQDAMQATLGMIAFIDDRVGAMMQALEETGQLENTVVVFTSDHGEIHGKHGFWHKGLMAYEDCQRVPYLVWGPGYVSKQGTSQALVNLVDLPRTFLSLAGVDIPLGMQGNDLNPLLRGKVEAVTDYTIVEMQATQQVYQQTFITQQYKLVVYRDFDDGELYDLQIDPDQYVNLWSNPKFAETKCQLMQRFIQANMQREGKVNQRLAFA